MTMAKITLKMSDELREAIDAQLEYGDSRSAWIRQAVIDRLDEQGVDTKNCTSYPPLMTAMTAD